jgi:redox-sensitive bicupin YhaK (pirin superfamily)
MTSAGPQRDVERIVSPGIQRGLTDAHRVRPLVPPTDFARTDPFLLLVEDWFPRGVFDRHPHRGIETVTYVLEGAVDHYDNHGNEGVIPSGDVLWLTAGRGLIHNEQPANGEPVHLLQLWINLPASDKLVPARFQELRASEMPVRRGPGLEMRVFSGASGSAIAPTANYTPTLLVEAKLDAGALAEQALCAGFNAFVIVLEGDGAIGASLVSVKTGDVVWLTRSDVDSAVTMRAGGTGLRTLLVAGQPLNEPVVARGPFVMNTTEQIQAAYDDIRRYGERFGLD